MKLLDLYCGSGGSGMGYHQAGFEVTGVDTKGKRNYPFEFIQVDAREILSDINFLKEFDVVTGSPPCQLYSRTKHLRDAQGGNARAIDMVPETREAFIKSGKPYVIENVPGSPLIDPITLCGSSFGLRVRRHRNFESNIKLQGLPCEHKSQGRPIGVYGSKNDNIPKGGKTASTLEEAQEAMGIDWMGWRQIVLAIPPAYTKFIGGQIYENINSLSRAT
jgi:DNA (cytosine-5)-methyltransferase 1